MRKTPASPRSASAASIRSTTPSSSRTISLAAHPQLGPDLFEAFAEAKRRYEPGTLEPLHQKVAAITGDPLPYGIEPNRACSRPSIQARRRARNYCSVGSRSKSCFQRTRSASRLTGPRQKRTRRGRLQHARDERPTITDRVKPCSPSSSRRHAPGAPRDVFRVRPDRVEADPRDVRISLDAVIHARPPDSRSPRSPIADAAIEPGTAAESADHGNRDGAASRPVPRSGPEWVKSSIVAPASSSSRASATSCAFIAVARSGSGLGMSAVLHRRLRRDAELRPDRDAGARDRANGLGKVGRAVQLHHVGAAFLDEADRRAHRPTRFPPAAGRTGNRS